MFGIPWQKSAKKRGGAVVVELAVTLPVFLLVLMGIIEVGRAMMVQQLLINGARIGARKAILSNATNTEVTQLFRDTCQATVGATVAVTVSVNGVSGADISTAEQGDLCEVNAAIAFSQVSFLPTPDWLNSTVLQGTCIMEHE